MIARGKLRDGVVAAVLSHIADHELSDGDSLPSERELSAEFGVSRTVVREALTALEMQGLLELVPGRRPKLVQRFGRAFAETLGHAVRADGPGLQNLMEVRRIVETEAAALAAARANLDDIAAMQAAVDRMRADLDAPAGYVDADVAFHEALLNATHNGLLIGMMGPAAALQHQSRRLTTGSRRSPASALAEHEAILERIRARDATGARKASAHHLDSTMSDLDSAFSDVPR